MPMTAHCRWCSAAYDVRGALPLQCPACLQTTIWTMGLVRDEPAKPYVLSESDLRLLRSFAIGQD